MKIEHMLNCSFQNWYSNFKNITVKSTILPLPDGFAEYILKEKFVVPQSSDLSYTVDAKSSDEDDSEIDWEDSSIVEAKPPHFPDFDEKIKAAIHDLGGKVFPKLNWSSPRDAYWIALNHSFCCTSVSNIYLLMKSSDFIIYDFTEALQQCEDYVQNKELISSLSQPSDEFYLVLRKWIDIDESGEFRCFIKNNNLIGISQRESSMYFDHIEVHRSSIIKDIVTFFEKNIQFKFPSSNYVFDVYRKKENHIRLIDFNPFGKMTDALLFSWEELKDESLAVQDDGHPEFRYLKENPGVLPPRFGNHALPKDIIDIVTGEDSFKLVDLMRLKIEEERKGESSSDEDEDDKV